MTADPDLEQLARDIDSVGLVVVARDSAAAVMTFWDACRRLPPWVRVPLLVRFAETIFRDIYITNDITDDDDDDEGDYA